MNIDSFLREHGIPLEKRDEVVKSFIYLIKRGFIGLRNPDWKIRVWVSGEYRKFYRTVTEEKDIIEDIKGFVGYEAGIHMQYHYTVSGGGDVLFSKEGMVLLSSNVEFIIKGDPHEKRLKKLKIGIDVLGKRIYEREREYNSRKYGEAIAKVMLFLYKALKKFYARREKEADTVYENLRKKGIKKTNKEFDKILYEFYRMLSKASRKTITLCCRTIEGDVGEARSVFYGILKRAENYGKRIPLYAQTVDGGWKKVWLDPDRIREVREERWRYYVTYETDKEYYFRTFVDSEPRGEKVNRITIAMGLDADELSDKVIYNLKSRTLTYKDLINETTNTIQF